MTKRRLTAFLCALMLLITPAARADILSEGSTGEDVAALQARLIELGLLGGKADGIYGKNTAAAMAEASRLLEAAGYTLAGDGSQAQALVFDESAEDALTALRLGCKGERVRELQSRLIDLKMLDGKADGSFGAATEAAVKRLQGELAALGAYAGEADGVADSDTRALVYSDLSVYGFKAPIYFDYSNPLALADNDLYSRSAVLIDAPTGEVLFDHGKDARMYPASTTKIMTLLLALERGGLQDIVVIPDCAADVPEDSTLVPVTPGESMRMIDLLYGLMLNSGNDAANAVAELCAGSVEAFVELMNRRAAELNMTGTRYANPHGYHDEGHYTTANDMATLARYGLTDPEFCKIATAMSYTMPATENREPLALANNCEIFDPASDYYIAGAAGVKKGYTSAAGFCYVGAAQRGGVTLIAVVLNAPSRNRAWMDLKKLFEYGFALS